MVCHLVPRHKIIRTECRVLIDNGSLSLHPQNRDSSSSVKHKFTRFVSEFSVDDQICVVFTGVFLISVSRLPSYRYNALIFYLCAYAYITISSTGILSQRDWTPQFNGEFPANKICFVIIFYWARQNSFGLFIKTDQSLTKCLLQLKCFSERAAIEENERNVKSKSVINIEKRRSPERKRGNLVTVNTNLRKSYYDSNLQF